MIFLACAAAGAGHTGGPSSPAPPAHGDGSPDLGGSPTEPSASLEPASKRARLGPADNADDKLVNPAALPGWGSYTLVGVPN